MPSHIPILLQATGDISTVSQTTGVPLSFFLMVSAILFCIGFIGVLTRRNILVIFMSAELMMNAVNLSLIAFGASLNSMAGQNFVVFVVTVAAAGLSIAAANNADAQRMGIGAQGSTNVGANVGVNAASRRAIVGTRAGLTARAQARGPALRPPGWSHGRKTGWHCRVGARGCIPPGLR